MRVERSLTVMRERASRSTSTEKLAALLAPRTLQHKKKRNYMKKKQQQQQSMGNTFYGFFHFSPISISLFKPTEIIIYAVKVLEP